MERVSVVCRSSHVSLFDLVPSSTSSWKEDVRAPKDVAALMHFFVQFAKDCQGGEVLRVEFDRPQMDSGAHAASAGAAGGAGAGGHKTRYGRGVGGAGGFGHQPLALGVGVGGLGVGGGGGGRSTLALSHTHGGGQQRKRGSMLVPAQSSSLPLHSNTLHQQQMAMAMQAASSQSPSSVSAGPLPAASPAASGGSNAAAAASSSVAASASAASPSSPGGSGVGSGVNSAGSLLSKGRMEMYCAQNEQIIVSVFVNAEYDKVGDVVAQRILSDFTSQFSRELAAAQIGSPGRLSSYPGGSEEALLDESFLPTFAAFRNTLEQSGLLRVEPKASAAAAAALLHASSSSALSASGSPDSAAAAFSPAASPVGNGRSLPATLLASSGSSSASPPLQPRYPSLGSSAPSFHTAFRETRGASVGGAVAAGAAGSGATSVPAAPSSYGGGFTLAGGGEDYLPSWIASDSAHELLLLQGTHDEHALAATAGGGGSDPWLSSTASGATADATSGVEMQAARVRGGGDGIDSQSSSPLIASTRTLPPQTSLDDVHISVP